MLKRHYELQNILENPDIDGHEKLILINKIECKIVNSSSSRQKRRT